VDILTFRLEQLAGAVKARLDALERRVLPAGGQDGYVLTRSGTGLYDALWEPLDIIRVGPTPPSNPYPGQLWVDTSS
jgi:hypothetical protein